MSDEPKKTWFVTIDDWLVVRFGLGWSWVVWTILMLWCSAALAYMTQWVIDTVSVVILIVLASAYAALTVLCSLFVYMTAKAGKWDDRRPRAQRKEEGW